MHESATSSRLFSSVNPYLPRHLCHASCQVQLEWSPVTEGSYENESILSRAQKRILRAPAKSHQVRESRTPSRRDRFRGTGRVSRRLAVAILLQLRTLLPRRF